MYIFFSQIILCFSSSSTPSNGNSLFNAVSMYLVGSLQLVDKLRVLVCLELYLNSKYYANHPVLTSIYDKNKHVFSNFKYIFLKCLSKSPDLSNLDFKTLIEMEAMCVDKVFPYHICILALSSVIKHKIMLHFPDFGSIEDQTLFKSEIFPRINEGQFSSINIFFCNLSGNIDNFLANHFVPLIRYSSEAGSKRVASYSVNPNSKQTKLDSYNPSLSKNIFHYFKVSSCSSTSNLSTFPLPSTSTSASSVVTSSSPLTATSSSLITLCSSSTSVTSLVSSTSTTISPICFEVSPVISTSSNFVSKTACKSFGPTPLEFNTLFSTKKFVIAFYFSISRKLTDKERYDCIKKCFSPEILMNLVVL